MILWDLLRRSRRSKNFDEILGSSALRNHCPYLSHPLGLWTTRWELCTLMQLLLSISISPSPRDALKWVDLDDSGSDDDSWNWWCLCAIIVVDYVWLWYDINKVTKNASVWAWVFGVKSKKRYIVAIEMISVVGKRLVRFFVCFQLLSFIITG